jgi:CBS domain containing-hemolysin-like protein
MRERRVQLALVTDDAGVTVGIVASEDLLEEVIGEFDDETDPIPAAARRASHRLAPAARSTFTKGVSCCC